MGRVIVDRQHSPAHNDWGAIREATLRAEDEGVDTVWVLDHFDGTVLGGDREMLECFSLLGALAAITTRVRLGTLVLNAANRHPAVTTTAVSTIARLSGGRFTLGLGAGADPASPWAREHRERGIPLREHLHERHDVVIEQIARVRAAESHAGHVPVIVGVNSERLARIAGQHADGVNIRLSSPHAARYIAAARDTAGDRPFETSGWANARDLASQERAHELGIDRLILCYFEPL